VSEDRAAGELSRSTDVLMISEEKERVGVAVGEGATDYIECGIVVAVTVPVPDAIGGFHKLGRAQHGADIVEGRLHHLLHFEGFDDFYGICDCVHRVGNSRLLIFEGGGHRFIPVAPSS
jgi:hypothetical protein